MDPFLEMLAEDARMTRRALGDEAYEQKLADAVIRLSQLGEQQQEERTMATAEQFEATQAAYAEAEYNIAQRLLELSRPPTMGYITHITELVQVAAMLQELQDCSLVDACDECAEAGDNAPYAMRYAGEDEAE